MNIISAFVKYTFLLFAFSYLVTGVSFIIYHAYYGAFLTLAQFMPYTALNIMMYFTIGGLLYIIYTYIYE